MQRALIGVGLLALCGGPAHAIVGEAPPADAVTARYTVIVRSAEGICSGAVVGQDLVLTAAHCVSRNDNSQLDAATVRIFGAIADAPVWLAGVKEISRHPKPSPHESKFGIPPDLALLKLSNQLPSRFGPAFLSTRPVGVGDRMIVVGFGKTEERANVKRVDAVLRGQPRMTMLAVTRLSVDVIELRNPPAGGDPRRLGTCYGDSGAPIFALRGGVPVLVAIVTGKPRGEECGGVTIATLLWRSRTWLLETASKLGSPLAA